MENMVVGKKYNYKNENKVYECTFTDNSLAVLSAGDFSFVVYKNSYRRYEEYKEPKTETFRKYFWKYGPDKFLSSDFKGVKTPVGKVEFTVTDGKITGAKIL